MENTEFMRKLTRFIFNNNIDEVKTIFKDKVPNDLLNHLVEKIQTYNLERPNNNSGAWIKFITNLDNENAEIFSNYIISSKLHIY